MGIEKPYESSDTIVWYKCAACGSIFYEDAIECKKCHGYLEEMETSVLKLMTEPGFDDSIGIEIKETDDENLDQVIEEDELPAEDKE